MNNHQMYQSMNLPGQTLNASASSPTDDEFDVDREQPREEKKFEMINSSQITLDNKTLTTVNEQQSDFNDTLGALNSDNNLASFNPPTSFARLAELGATAKREDQRATMTSMMRP